MGVFGPKYAPPFQAIINHADRFCALLLRFEECSPPRDVLGRGWLIGRTSEIEAVLALVVRDWDSGRIDLQQATRSASGYLGELHEVARKRLGLGGALDCCAEDDALTRIVAREQEAVTRVVAVKKPGVGDGVSTWFDPSALLDFRETPRVAPTRGPVASSAITTQSTAAATRQGKT